jgi:hypothetical protein
VELAGIHFVKVYTGVNQYCGWLGETSTEIMGAEDFHIQGIEIDVLGVKAETLPNARAWYAQGKLHLENLNDCHCTIYNVTGQIITNFNINNSNETHEMNAIPGIYFIKIQKQNINKIYKIIIY